MLYILRYLKYLWKSKSRYSVHSPFLFHLVNTVFKDKRHFYAFTAASLIRNDLKQSRESLATKHLGASSKQPTSNRVKRLVTNISIRTKDAKLLFKLVQHFQPNSILELGTGLGISTIYLATGTRAKVITLEGNDARQKVAEQNFAKLHLDNITTVLGDFAIKLPLVLSSLDTIDFAFIDGNHQYEPTCTYFNQIMEKTSVQSVLVLHDIHWSKEMEAAWSYIKQDPRVTLTVDLFSMGLVFLHEGQEKEDFILRY